MRKKPKASLPLDLRRANAKEEQISFSFKYHDSGHDYFTLHGQDIEYVYDILERFKNLADFTAGKLIGNGSRALRCHPIRWEDTTQKGFGSLRPELYEGCAYQIEISQAKGRVHGFFIGAVFHVVWFDPEHRLYR